MKTSSENLRKTVCVCFSVCVCLCVSEENNERIYFNGLACCAYLRSALQVAKCSKYAVRVVFIS